MTFFSSACGRGSPKKRGKFAKQWSIKESLGLHIPSASESHSSVLYHSLISSNSMASFVAPKGGPEYGRRLIPTLVDEMAASTPEHVYALIPRHQDFTGGFHDVTSRTLARAVNKAAFWIEQKLGKCVDFETIAYLGPSKACMSREGCR